MSRPHQQQKFRMENWIYSDGAPFVCATQSIRKLWKGVSGSSIGATESDYERVCKETTYLSAISCCTSQVLVLGDEPAQAAFFTTPGGPVIARWIACDSMELADSMLKQVPAVLPHLQPAVQFQIDEPQLWMFDASSNSAMPAAPTSVINLSPGRFEVTTERYREERAFDFWIHRFVRSEH